MTFFCYLKLVTVISVIYDAVFPFVDVKDFENAICCDAMVCDKNCFV